MNKTKNSIAILLIVFLTCKITAQSNLTKVTLLNKQVQIKVPTGFKQLTTDEINRKFARGRRPSVVFSSKNGKVNLTLDLKPTQITQEGLVKYEKNYNFMFNRYRIDKTKKNPDIIIINKHKIGVLKLVMPSATGKLYTLMFYTNIGNQMLMGSFYYPETSKIKWQAIEDEIVNSLSVKKN